MLAPLLERPRDTAILTDFDGTLSPIVARPELARPLEGAAELLDRLAARFAVVAVVSGRPVSFLVEHLALPGSMRASVPPPARFVGLYGIEWADGNGGTTIEPSALAWRPVLAEVLARLERAAPSGALVESKGLAVTVHWRGAPEAEPWAVASVAAEVARTGLESHPGRCSIELRPPLPIDKGSVTRSLVERCSAAVYLGDDVGDLPAFDALDALREESGLSAVKVAVADEESAPEVLDAADLVLGSADEVLDVFEWLASSGT